MISSLTAVSMLSQPRILTLLNLIIRKYPQTSIVLSSSTDHNIMEVLIEDECVGFPTRVLWLYYVDFELQTENKTHTLTTIKRSHAVCWWILIRRKQGQRICPGKS